MTVFSFFADFTSIRLFGRMEWAARQALEEKVGLLQENVKMIANRENNAAAMKIAVLDLVGDTHKANVSSGHGVGRGPSPSLRS
jgi:hypothetical protein